MAVAVVLVVAVAVAVVVAIAAVTAYLGPASKRSHDLGWEPLHFLVRERVRAGRGGCSGVAAAKLPESIALVSAA